jgi:hypothetical protein
MTPRKPARLLIFITLFLDVPGIGLVVPILPGLVEELAAEASITPPTSSTGSSGSMP